MTSLRTALLLALIAVFGGLGLYLGVEFDLWLPLAIYGIGGWLLTGIFLIAQRQQAKIEEELSMARRNLIAKLQEEGQAKLR